VTRALLLLLAGCAAGPHDTLGGGGGAVVQAEAGAPVSYSYIAKRPLVVIGLAKSDGISDAEAHATVDRVAESATACFRRAQKLVPGVARITLPVDSGGVAGAPAVSIAPPDATALGMLCVLAPLRLSTFSPGGGDAGDRSLTIETAWGGQ
jgi:hypothetical protein